MHFTQTFPNSTVGIDFIPARLTEGKEWYVSFYALFPPSGKLRRRKIKLNRIRSATEKRKMGRRLILEINEKLARGWNPFVEDVAPKSFHRFADVLQTYMDIQSKDLKPFSFKSYKSMAKRMLDFLVEMGKDPETMLVYHFDSTVAADIMLRIKRDPNISARTFNNYLIFFKAFFNWMKSFSYIPKNPFENIKKQPKKRTAGTERQLFTKDMLADLRDFLAERNPRYFAMCLMCYYCFVRPNEITYIKLKDIDLKNQIVYIRADHAKNARTSTRTIPDAMLPYLTALDWSGSPEDYAFSDDVTSAFVPGRKHLDPLKIARYWLNVRRHFGWPTEIQFYNLKHTGITNMLADGVAPNFVQGQADHHSLEMTSVYAATQTPVSQKDIREKASAF